MSEITYGRLLEVLDYEPSTGLFLWKEMQGSARPGDIAGTYSSKGYIDIGVDGKIYRAHRLAWLFINGYLPENDIDHINGSKIDNRIENLRETSRSCNMINRGEPKNNKSGIKGVCFHKQSGKWMSTIGVNKRHITLGVFDDFDEAVCFRLAAEQCLGHSDCIKSSAHLYVLSITNKNKGGQNGK